MIFVNYYIELISRAVDYIEENIERNITLGKVSENVHLSQYHFDRLFNIIVGTSLKKYVLGRKLAIASEYLVNSKTSILNIALDLGFKYPEVFSRAFKREFGVSPRTFRHEKLQIKKVDKAKVIPRALVNYNGGLVLNENYISLDNIELKGVSTIIDVYENGFEHELEKVFRKYLKDSEKYEELNNEKFYSLVNCHGEGSSTYSIYCGKEFEKDPEINGMSKVVIPKSLYAIFEYKGRMSVIRRNFEDDLFRWIAIKEIQLNPVGISMISMYDKDYYKNEIIKILIPVKE